VKVSSEVVRFGCLRWTNVSLQNIDLREATDLHNVPELKGRQCWAESNVSLR
jgi:hypothetical protein